MLNEVVATPQAQHKAHIRSSGQSATKHFYYVQVSIETVHSQKHIPAVDETTHQSVRNDVTQWKYRTRSVPYCVVTRASHRCQCNHRLNKKRMHCSRRLRQPGFMPSNNPIMKTSYCLEDNINRKLSLNVSKVTRIVCCLVINIVTTSLSIITENSAL